ncbi:hypothetical protein [Desulforhopalus singaporensis]|uniref:Uncharacterized protein n=1 Tax=Desulforhopalus singaporensis TaxID=91360 RepID=A0A1H0QDS3_9BACT|nr:hypothetical protein [Desulforhopalus singaporensis]SDP15205.1 hypothetical protein SAMN05660330_01950 [Desulforhopalus singaporensis]
MRNLNVYITVAGIYLLVSFLMPGPAWALQSHGAPEGICVHQMAHILFAGALAYLYWHTRKSPAIASRGWRYLQYFCGILIAWNLLAFTGHELYELLTPEDFINKDTWSEQLSPPLSGVKIIYYIAKMDHVFMVPALFYLVRSLKTFYREARLEVNK